MTTYTEAIEYLYARLPMFTRDGASAFNKDLDRTIALCNALGNPQDKIKTIHVGGTNGKGSSSHMLASVISTCGYKTGLYTSPHLIDFRERIRVDGLMIEETFVVDFVHTYKDIIEEIQPSFFEATVVMAFDYFAKNQVDVAVIEVGLGGRLDSTNVIQPLISLITNIGMDHMNMLGDTLQEIAAEKAGIIKSDTPVVISERNQEIASVFIDKAKEMNAPLVFASDEWEIESSRKSKDFFNLNICHITTNLVVNIQLDLLGIYQSKNVVGVWSVIERLKKMGFDLPEERIKLALSEVQKRTGLMGRWYTLSKEPWIICDTGHNEDGIKEVVKNLSHEHYQHLHVVIGAMKDKDLSHILPLLPKEATYYFCAPDMPRAMSAYELKNEAKKSHLYGHDYPAVDHALLAAKANYGSGDLIFVGGSTFVVAEVLTSINSSKTFK